MRKKSGGKDKRGLVWSEIAWWVIGLLVLGFVIFLLIILQKQGINLLEKIKDFGR